MLLAYYEGELAVVWAPGIEPMMGIVWCETPDAFLTIVKEHNLEWRRG